LAPSIPEILERVSMKAKLLLIGKLVFLAFLLLFVGFHGLQIPTSILNKLPQFVTIFTSIVIQALPFVLIGVFGSALMQKVVTVEMVENRLAKTAKLQNCREFYLLLALDFSFRCVIVV
jgi:uncharacterized membrane protein YraQ (UPF0718 family)